MIKQSFDPRARKITKWALAGRDYKPKNGKGYNLQADKNYQITFSDTTGLFEILEERKK